MFDLSHDLQDHMIQGSSGSAVINVFDLLHGHVFKGVYNFIGGNFS